jgi:glycosyltransferase involved in cell wall biosynthesis
MKTISVVLTVHNKENLIDQVVNSIFENMSAAVKEFIVVFDGCTDKSEQLFNFMMSQMNRPCVVTILHEPGVFEIKANNAGLKQVHCDYACLIQDDMVIKEPEFDQRLLKPFQALPEVFAVTGRDACDLSIKNGRLSYDNMQGWSKASAKNKFYIRDIVNRGPLMFDTVRLKSLNYLDETLCPISHDDFDICLKAYRERSWIAGAYWISYDSDKAWGTSRQKSNPNRGYINRALKRNELEIIKRYQDVIEGEKHSREIII